MQDNTELFVAEPRTVYQDFPPLVVDCSVLAVLLFHEPKRDVARARLVEKSLYVPDLIDSEMCSVALKKAAAGLHEIARQGLDNFIQLRLTRCTPDVRQQFALARSNGITAYDAAYLQLAVELQAPLATFDKQLAEAAAAVLGGG